MVCLSEAFAVFAPIRPMEDRRVRSRNKPEDDGVDRLL